MPVSGITLPPTYSLQQSPVFDMGLVINATAATTTQASADLNVNCFKGITVVLNVAAVGTASLQVAIDGKDYSNSGNYWTLLLSGAVTANGTTAHTIYPGITPGNTANSSSAASNILPVYVRVRVVAGNSNPATYTVGAVLTT